MAITEQLVENASRHAVFVQRFAGSLHREFIPFLEQLQIELRNRLLTEDPTPFTQARLRKLISDTTAIQREIYDNYNLELFPELESFSHRESQWEFDNLDSVIVSPSIELDLPAPVQVWSAVRNTPLVFEGSDTSKLLEPFVRDWERSEITRANDIIRTGIVTGETTDQIARRLTGKGGHIDKQTRRNNRTIVTTATNHVSTQARLKTMEENDDIVKGYRLIATLDRSTTDQCRSWDQVLVLNEGKIIWPDGKTQKTNYRPAPAFHPNCRTTVVSELDQRYAIDDSDATRASAGATGGKQVNAEQSYYSWLKTQPASFQDSAIGPTRGRLLRNGGLTADEFARLSVDDRFRPLTLQEMREADPAAFEQAGL